MTTRREAIAAIGGGLVTLAGCSSRAATDPVVAFVDGPGRLSARPHSLNSSATLGTMDLPLTLGLSGVSYFPPTYRSTVPAPVALLLHGNSDGASELIQPLAPIAATVGLVLLGVSSADVTWDLVKRGSFGLDVSRINTALGWLFDRCNVDTSRIGVFGFSDGATYALALGRVNGDFFRRIVAYSPGDLAAVTAVGKPQLYISHGTSDSVLSAAVTRQVTVPQLQGAGYAVEYHEFDGGHGVPQSILDASTAWFVRPAS